MTRKLVLTCLFLIIFMILLGSSMSKQFSRDEQMYTAGGVLMSHGQLIYRDFSYVAQLPYHPLLYAGIYKLFQVDHYLLAARLVSVLSQFGICLLIFLLALKAFRPFGSHRDYLAFAAVLLYILNPFADYAAGRAWNHDVVIFLSLLALFVYLSSLDRFVRLPITAALLTIAAFMRPTTAMLWPIFFISLLSEDFPSRTQKLKAIAAFLAASAIAAAWPLYVLAKASDAAYINLIVIPLLNGEFLNKIGMTFNKPALALNVLFTPAYFLLTLLFLISSLSVLARFRSRLTRQYVITSCVAVAFIVIAFVPPTIWLQYFAPPVAFMIISICFAANAISSDRPGSGRLVRIFAIVVIIITAVYNDTPVKYISAAFNSKQWVPVKFHKQAADIASLAGTQKLTLTLAPLAALESGNTIYPGLAAGPFAYRVADFLTPPQRKVANVFGPSDVPSLVADRPPSIVILADEKPESLEKPLSDSAPGWNARFLSEPLSLTVLYKSAK